ncbi:MAG: cysteine hydrolase [Deltaproteobacteria bacterium]|nr:cysteine hydrolase [Deltaproteobacteria bacterium]
MIEFEGRVIATTLDEVADPRRAVLLVWDMQNDQAGSSFNKEEFLRTTPPLIAAAKRAGVRVVYAFATPYPWRDEAPAMIRRAMKDQGVNHPGELGPRRTRGSFGWQLIEPFKPEDDDVLIEKHRPTIFLGTEFEQLLGNWNRDAVVVVGCRTDAGVEGSVRDGYYRGYSMIVVRDCVGTNRENAHHEALRRMERFADVVDSRQLLDIWNAAADRSD